MQMSDLATPTACIDAGCILTTDDVGVWYCHTHRDDDRWGVARALGAVVPCVAETERRNVTLASGAQCPVLAYRLATNDSLAVRLQLARADLPTGASHRLTKDESPLVRRTMAMDTRALASSLTTLANDSDREVRARVAANPCAPPDALVELLADSDEVVRKVAAANPGVSAT